MQSQVCHLHVSFWLDSVINSLGTIIGNRLHVVRQPECMTGQRASIWLVMHTVYKICGHKTEQHLIMHDLTEQSAMFVCVCAT